MFVRLRDVYLVVGEYVFVVLLDLGVTEAVLSGGGIFLWGRYGLFSVDVVCSSLDNLFIYD